jgi:uncharacterized protein (UPF0216 family)
MFMQGVNKQFRGNIKINVDLKELGNNSEPFIVVEIDNSKFEIKKKEADRLSNLSSENDFSKILEAKVDMNYKIAKVLTNALNWQVNFNAFKSGK